MRPLFSRVALIVLSTCAALGMAEVALRLYGIEPSIDRLVRYEFDETLGWVPKRHFKYYRSSRRYGHFNYFGPDGFPTTQAEFDTPASTSARSLAVLGDSFAESYYASSYEVSFPYLLGTYLPEYQILNLGVSGYAPDQYLLRARRELPRFVNTEKIVVMFFPFNDLPDLNRAEYEGYGKPYFQETFQKPLNTPLKRADVSGAEGGWISRTIRNTAVYAIVRPLRRAPSKDRPTSVRSAVDDERLLNKALRLIRQITAENPRAALLVYRVSDLKEYQAIDVFHRNVALYRQQCAQLDLWCADMEPILSSAEDPRQLYLVGDGHFSDLGSVKVAQQLRELVTAGR